VENKESVYPQGDKKGKIDKTVRKPPLIKQKLKRKGQE